MNDLAKINHSQVSLSHAQTSEDLVVLWLMDKKSVQSRRSYVWDLKRFVAFWKYNIGQNDDPDTIAKINAIGINEIDLHSIKIEILTAYRERLIQLEKQELITRSTTRRRLNTIKSVLKYACQVGFILGNPAANLRVPEPRTTHLEKFLTKDEIADIRATARFKIRQGDDRYALRNLFIFELLYKGGFRVGEIENLTWGSIWINPQGSPMLRVLGKGDSERSVKIPQELYMSLCTTRHTQDCKEPLFKSRKGGKPITANMIRVLISKMAKDAGVEKKVSPHWLRHSHATHAIQNGADIDLVGRGLGHKSKKTTVDFYLHSNSNDGVCDYLD